MPSDPPVADWSRLREEPDLEIPLPGGPKMLFRRIPAGSFWMGGRGGTTEEEPRHRVMIRRDYCLGKFVVTQAEWRAVAALSPLLMRSRGVEPSAARDRGAGRPVTGISWDDIRAWCSAFTEHAQLPAGAVARLPTAAEWEYACRAGSETDYYNGDGEGALMEVAWFGEKQGHGAHAVDERAESHPAGLQGMHGNVQEWCRDVHYFGARRRWIDGEVDPVEHLRVGDRHGDQARVIRGGSVSSLATACRSAVSDWGLPLGRSWNLGFRVCLATEKGRERA